MKMADENELDVSTSVVASKVDGKYLQTKDISSDSSIVFLATGKIKSELTTRVSQYIENQNLK